MKHSETSVHLETTLGQVLWPAGLRVPLVAVAKERSK